MLQQPGTWQEASSFLAKTVARSQLMVHVIGENLAKALRIYLHSAEFKTNLEERSTSEMLEGVVEELVAAKRELLRLKSVV